MLFRRRSRSHDSPVVQIVGDCSVQLSPTKAPKTHTRHALEETIILSPNSPNSPNSSHQRGGSSDGSYRSFNSSPDQSPVYCKEPAPERTPLSRKTGYATIRTDSTDTQPAFESDAFAVLMPTTRLPILDRPISSTKAASSTARADAFKTYQEKAQQIRERNNSQGVKVPSRIVSYDYASRQLAGRHTTSEVKVISPTPAGSFPISPPLPQHTWVKPEKVAGGQEQGSRHVHGFSNVNASRKPITETTSTFIVPTLQLVRRDLHPLHHRYLLLSQFESSLSLQCQYHNAYKQGANTILILTLLHRQLRKTLAQRAQSSPCQTSQGIVL
jgi:hypothetical protein